MRVDGSFIPLQMRQPGDTNTWRTIEGARPLSTGAPSGAPDSGETSFTEVLREALARVNESQQQADVAVRRVATGEADDLHDAIIALEKADLTLRLTAQVTQRAISAYQEISRMQL